MKSLILKKGERSLKSFALTLNAIHFLITDN